MRIRSVGAHALLLDFTTDDDAPEVDLLEAWRAELWRRREQGDLVAVEIVPAASTVLLDGLPDPTATAEQMTRWAPAVVAATIGPATADVDHAAVDQDAVATADVDQAVADQDAVATADVDPIAADRGPVAKVADRDAREIVVPVSFDGPDLPAVAEHWNVDVPAVLRRLTGTRFRVAFCGFAPGFPYLTGLPAELALPRLATPRPRVPAGSVALAGPYAGIYPGASPGGWQLVGRTDLVLFDVHADPPARLGPGTPVRMVAT